MPAGHSPFHGNHFISKPERSAGCLESGGHVYTCQPRLPHQGLFTLSGSALLCQKKRQLSDPAHRREERGLVVPNERGPAPGAQRLRWARATTSGAFSVATRKADPVRSPATRSTTPSGPPPPDRSPREVWVLPPARRPSHGRAGSAPVRACCRSDSAATRSVCSCRRTTAAY
jgi:hypothetical protein